MEHPKAQSTKIYNIQEVVDYVVCPAKSFINMYSKDLPDRQKAFSRLRNALQEIGIHMIGKDYPDDKEELLDSIVSNVFKDLDYNQMTKDMKSLREVFDNFIKMLPGNDLIIEALEKEITVEYGDYQLKSQIDFMVRDTKRGIKCPLIVDLSRTKYEPFYNPITYKCQTVTDFMDAFGTNTEIIVLTPNTGKKWLYRKSIYGPIISASLTETLLCMNMELHPVRFGWWCAGCYWRGICHKMMETKAK